MILVDQLRSPYVPFPRAPLTGIVELGLQALRSKLMAEKIRAAGRAKMAAHIDKIIFEHMTK